MNETKHVAMNAKQQEQLDQILRGICKERKAAVEADLDSRLSYREKDLDKPKQASWGAYSRFLLSDGHTVYVNLRSMEASVSKEPDKYAQGKVEKRLAKQKKAAERKAAREAKAAAKVKAAAKPKVTVKAKTVTEDVPGATTASAKHNARKAKKVPAVKVVKFDESLPTLE